MFYTSGELEILKDAKNYYKWILEEFNEFLYGHCLEIGSGYGTFSKYILESNVKKLTCIEPAQNLLPKLRKNLKNYKNYEIHKTTLENFKTDKSFDCIVCVNVLEHIRNDYLAMKKMYTLLKKGGNICIFVPAHQFLYGSLDKVFLHYRRYDKKRLTMLAKKTGFKIIKLRYFNSLGVFSWFLMSRIFKIYRFNKTSIKIYDNLVVPVMKKIEKIFTPPFGQSLLMIGKKV